MMLLPLSKLKLILIDLCEMSCYTTGGKGGAGGGTYSPSGKVRIQFHVGLFTISCLSWVDKNKYHTEFISATQLKNCESV